MDNKELIARYDRWSERPTTGSILQSERFQGFARELRDALEAAEAELTAAHAAIAGSPTKAERVASLVKSATRLVQIERDDARAALTRAEAELTRRDTVIERIRSGVARRLDQDWDDTQLIETPVWNALDRIDRIIADHREAVAASPVSLEAVKAETATAWAETTEYAYGHLDAPDTIVATGEDIDDRGSAECNAEEFWAQVLERTVRRSEWRPVSTEGDAK